MYSGKSELSLDDKGRIAIPARYRASLMEQCAGRLVVKVFNLRGELVRTLLDEARPAGPTAVIWDGTDGRGRAVASGVYFYEARTGDRVHINKLALVR